MSAGHVTFERGASAIGWLLAGLLVGPMGVALLFSNAPWVGVAMAAFGLPLLAVNAWVLIRRPPRLRLGPDGVWFGGGTPVPWSEIKSVYLATVTTTGTALSRLGPSRALAFEFHDKARSLRRLPWSTRLRSKGAVGDIDLSSADFKVDVVTVMAQISRVQSESAAA